MQAKGVWRDVNSELEFSWTGVIGRGFCMGGCLEARISGMKASGLYIGSLPKCT